MTKTKVYQYTSSNGTVLTSIDLEIGNPKIFYILNAGYGKILTNGKVRISSIQVLESEILLWQEVEKTVEEIEKERESHEESKSDEANYKELLDIITGEENGEVI